MICQNDRWDSFSLYVKSSTAFSKKTESCCKAFPCLGIDLLIKSSQRKFIVICILYTVLPSLNFTQDFSLKYLGYPLVKTTQHISQVFGRIKITAFESHRDLALRAAL